VGEAAGGAVAACGGADEELAEGAVVGGGRGCHGSF
jgi:hypothetical protein